LLVVFLVTEGRLSHREHRPTGKIPLIWYRDR